MIGNEKILDKFLSGQNAKIAKQKLPLLISIKVT